MLVIDPGHGGENAGCCANGFVEKTLTLSVARCLADLARVIGIPVGLTREEDVGRSFSQRREMAQRSGAAQVLSLHFDANIRPDVGGLTCYCEKSDERSRALAERLSRAVPTVLNARIRPIFVEPAGWKSRAYHVVASFGIVPTLLVECAFLTNPAHASFLRSYGQEALCAGVLAAIAAHRADASVRQS